MIKEIYFAGGCFWGSEKLFSQIKGVTDTCVGYANGDSEQHANYESVCTGLHGFRETVQVRYDTDTVSLATLLKAFFSSIDPTMFNRQGFDMGTQYQTGVYWSDPSDEQVIKDYASAESTKYIEFYTEIKPLSCFYPAEEYHQKYLEKNPSGYCHISPSKISAILNDINI